MAELILHIGHGKTGSSAIQSWLALNRDLVSSIGYDYPEHSSFPAARKGFITSGNGRLLEDQNFEFTSNTLLSNEIFVNSLADDQALEGLLTRFDCRLRVVLYTRNLFGFLVSQWGQSIKRSAAVHSLNDYLQSTDGGHHPRVLYWINASKKFGFELILKNYSVHRDNLICNFLTAAFGDAGARIAADPSQMPVNIVNRSLTETEYLIQRAFNRYTAKSSQYISDALVNELPDIKAETCHIEPAAYQSVVHRMTRTIDAINTFIDPEERVEIETYDDLSLIMNPPVEDGGYTITERQADVLARRLAAEINKGLSGYDAHILNNIAVKIEKGGTPDLKDALELMSLALRARPETPSYQRKVEYYKSRLNAKRAG